MMKRYYNDPALCDNVIAIANLGGYYQTIKKKYDKMMKYYDKVIKMSKTNKSCAYYDVMIRLGEYCKYIRKDTESALEYFMKASKSDNKIISSIAHNMIGISYKSIGKYPLSKKHYKKSILGTDIDCYPMYNLGLVYYHRNEPNVNKMIKYYVMSYNNGFMKAMDTLLEYLSSHKTNYNKLEQEPQLS